MTSKLFKGILKIFLYATGPNFKLDKMLEQGRSGYLLMRGVADTGN